MFSFPFSISKKKFYVDIPYYGKRKSIFGRNFVLLSCDVEGWKKEENKKEKQIFIILPSDSKFFLESMK
jgi:hypothetical protein